MKKPLMTAAEMAAPEGVVAVPKACWRKRQAAARPLVVVIFWLVSEKVGQLAKLKMNLQAQNRLFFFIRRCGSLPQSDELE